MATYTYTGRLTDFGEAPFPDAKPRLWVEARVPAFGPNGPLAPRRIPVTVASNGDFTVDLVASVDTNPTVEYVLRVEWLHVDEEISGWSEWPFTAVIGGGQIKDMGPGAPLSVWFVGPPWPANTPPGFYYDKLTDDVGRKN